MAKFPSPIEVEISKLAGIWRETENPAAAWKCFALARENGLPVPEVIDAEIVRFAQAVTAPLANDRDTITAGTVTAAWGLAKGFKPAPELRNARRDVEVWLEYWELRRGGVSPDAGLARNDAISTLADKRNMSPKTIEGILDHFAKEYGPDDPFAMHVTVKKP
jgi:hypothetical protein